MIKKHIYGDGLKGQLKARAKDKIHRFILADGKLRGAICHTTAMVNEMRANHDLGILESLVLGQAYTAASLLTINLKGEDRIAIKIECDGPIKGLSVESNAFGEVRGFLSKVPIPVDRPPESFDLSSFFGSGTMSIIKTLEGAEHPFTGQVPLTYGAIGQDLAYFFVASEQVPTAVVVSVFFNKAGEITGSGGILIQALPGAPDHLLEDVQEAVSAMPSVGESFADGHEAMQLIEDALGMYSPKLLESKRLAFMCHCSKKRFNSFIQGLPMKDLSEMVQNGPFPIVTKCHNCSTTYEFSEEEISVALRLSEESHRFKN